MKTLNLDLLAKSSRTLTLGGTEYAVVEMTVENFIETTKSARKLEEDKTTTFSDQVEASIDMIKRSIPSIPVELLRALTIEQMITVSRFIRGELDEETTKEVAVEETKAGGKKK